MWFRGKFIKDDYNARDRVLAEIGFASYSEYLRSTLWRSIRAKVRERDRNLCLCGNPAAHVHHRNYYRQTMTGECLSALQCVCEACHTSKHKPEWMATRIYRRRMARLRGEIPPMSIDQIFTRKA